MSPKNPISFLGIPEFLVVGFLALFLAASGATAQVQFSGPTDYPVGTAPATAAVGDFNGDDKPGIIPRGKEKSAPFRIVKEEASAYWSQISWVGLLSAHADQAEKIIKPRVDPKWIKPGIALSKAG